MKVAREVLATPAGRVRKLLRSLRTCPLYHAPRRSRPASAPPVPVRHGKCSLHLSIGGTRYRLQPLTPPAGFKAVWSLRKADADRLRRLPGRHREGPAAGLHLPRFHRQRRRLQAHRGVEGPRPHPRPEGPPGGRPPQPCPPPGRAPPVRPRPSGRGGGAGAVSARGAGSFTEGFRSAVAAELRRQSGQVEPETEPDETCRLLRRSVRPGRLARSPLLRPARRKGMRGESALPHCTSIGPESSGPTSSRWPRSSAPRNTTTSRAVDHPRPRRGRRPAGRPDGPHARWAAHPRAVRPGRRRGGHPPRRSGPGPRRRGVAGAWPTRSPSRPVGSGGPGRRSAASSPTSSSGWPSSSPSPAPGRPATSSTGSRCTSATILAQEYDRGYSDGRGRSAGYCPR